MRASHYAELRAFAAVVRYGAFSRAAAHLGISASALSQKVNHLEDRLGQRLLNRTTRSVSPTEVGAALAGRLLPVLDDLEAAVAVVSEHDGAPSGRLRINASRLAALHIITPLLGTFLAQHPRITLELVADDALVDIVAAGFDAGVRLGERLEQDMIAVPLGGSLRMAVVGAPDYLSTNGIPQHPHDLIRHRCLSMRWPTDRSPYRWEFERAGEEIKMAVEGQLVCDEPAVRLQACRDGLGLAYVFEPEAAAFLASGHLIRVLEEWTPPFPGCYLYYAGRRHVTAALRAFIDHAKSALQT